MKTEAKHISITLIFTINGKNSANRKYKQVYSTYTEVQVTPAFAVNGHIIEKLAQAKCQEKV